MKIVATQEDGTEIALFDQAHVDEAVATAIAALPPAPVVTPEDQEVDIIHTDGTIGKFVRATE